MMTNSTLAEIAQQIREAVTIRRVLRDMGVALHEKPGGRAFALCPLHQEDTPSFRIFPIKDQNERFRCFGCGQRGDVFDLVQLLDGYPDYVSTLRALAEKHHIPWPSKASRDEQPPHILDLATHYYERHITDEVLAYLDGRGFPKAFVADWHLGYGPPAGTGELRAMYERRGLLRQALEIGILDRARRDAFRCRIVFPNRLGGHTVDLQGRLLPPRANTEEERTGPLYLNLPRPHVRLFNEPATLHKEVFICEGIPDTLSVLRAGIPACGIYGAQGWREAYRAKFRRCELVYVALDRDAVDKSIALAREFGRRGRVIVPPEELGPKGDLNDWLRTIAKGDPEVFKKLLAAAMEEDVTPWELLIVRLPTVPRKRLWKLEDDIKQLLADLAPLSCIFRAGHLVPLAEKTGLPLPTLEAACEEIADSSLDDEATPTAATDPSA
jgi:DNA primase